MVRLDGRHQCEIAELCDLLDEQIAIHLVLAPVDQRLVNQPHDGVGDQMRIKRRQWGLVTFLDGNERRARWYRLGAVGRPDENGQLKVRLIGPDLPAVTAKITFFEGLEGVFTRTMSVTELPVGST